MGRVVVVGSVNMDAVARVDHLPVPGETVGDAELSWFPGGKGANQAVAAVRQGAATALVAALGQDDAGRSLREMLAGEGVDVSAVTVEHDVPTGLAMIAVDVTGANTIVVAPGSNRALSPTHVEAAADLIASAAVVVCQLEIPLATVTSALQLARQAGAVTVLNPSPAQPLADELLALVDVVVANEVEAAQLPPAPSCAVVVTLGERGAVLRSAGHVSEHPSFPVTAIDSTGAGDAFCGALAAAVAHGRTLGDAVSKAVAAGAIAVTRAGALPSMPTAAEVAALLEKAAR